MYKHSHLMVINFYILIIYFQCSDNLGSENMVSPLHLQVMKFCPRPQGRTIYVQQPDTKIEMKPLRCPKLVVVMQRSSLKHEKKLVCIFKLKVYTFPGISLYTFTTLHQNLHPNSLYFP